MSRSTGADLETFNMSRIDVHAHRTRVGVVV